MINKIIYHILEKEQGSTENVEIVLNPDLISVNPTTNELLRQLVEKYKGKAGKGYGIFESDTDSFPASAILNDYLDASHEDDFISTTERFMNVLKATCRKQAGAKGGKVVFIDYIDDDKHYFLVALLSEKIGLLAKNWELKQEEILNIDNMRFAGRINITDWQNNSNSKYISFLKGQGEVSDYFKHLLGCDDAVMASEETKKLVSCIRNFANNKNLNVDARADFNSKVDIFLREISVDGKQFSLQSFANNVWSNDPQELVEYFEVFVNENGATISDGFIPDKRYLKGLTVHTQKAKHWGFSFDRDAVDNGDVSVVEGKIIFNNPSDEILQAYTQS